MHLPQGMNQCCLYTYQTTSQRINLKLYILSTVRSSLAQQHNICSHFLSFICVEMLKIKLFDSHKISYSQRAIS